MSIRPEYIPYLKRSLCAESFYDFVWYARPDYEFNWHHVELIEALQRLADRQTRRLIVMMPPRHGKALEVNTPIPTPSGWKRIVDLVPGDVVFDENGMPCNVVTKSPVWKNRESYKVITDSGDVVIADAEHEWPVRLCRKRPVFKTKTTKWLADRTSKRNPLLLKSGALQLAEKDLPVDPYFLGIWLGDGNSRCARITMCDGDFMEVSDEIKRRGLKISHTRKDISVGILGVQKAMKKMGLMPKKFIPEIYLRASESQRLDLVRGLVDSDGHVANDGQVEFCSTNENIATGFKELINSLGYKASLITGRATLNGEDFGTKYRVMFYAKDVAILKRKNKKTKDSVRGNHYLTFEYAGKHDTVCIEVDSKSHLFLCGKGMIPTHNSELVSRLFPAWILGRNPAEQIITSSYSAELASAMNRDCQRIISSTQYREIFPDTKLPDGKQANAVRNNSRFDIVGQRGYYVSAGVGGGITGVGCTVGIIDDPVKNAQEADSATYRESAWEWYTTTFKTRFEPRAIEVVCQTRWHEDDLTGRILQTVGNDPQTEIISFPALAEKKEPYRGIGEALWEDKYDREKLLSVQTEVGSRAWSALYQQRPSPDEGGLIKKQWFTEYDPKKVDLSGSPVKFYIDTAYTDREKNDPTAALAYVRIGADIYLTGGFSKQIDFNVQMTFVNEFATEHGYTNRSIIFVEPKATGKSLVQVLKKQTALNIKEAEAPKESKVARVNSVSAMIEAGRVHVPKGQVWVLNFLNECAAFPNAAHDDQVDCLSGILINEFKQAKAPRRTRIG